MSDSAQIFEVATTLFKAFASGVARQDVRAGKMSKDQADRWVEHSVSEFKSNLTETAQ